MPVLSINDAASALNVSESTVRRWIKRGAPCARTGSRGRGHRTLIDLRAIAAWRRAQDGTDALRALAGDVPELVSKAMLDAYLLVEGPHKRLCGDVLCGAALLVVGRLRDRIRVDLPDIEPDDLPVAIVDLQRKIGRR